MSRKRDRKAAAHTRPDHRPMLPELRRPDNPMDLAVRAVRCRYFEISPDLFRKWR